MSLLLLALLLQAADARVAEPGAALRAECAKDAAVVAHLEAGAALEVRSSITTEAGTCYRVAAAQGGGYLRHTEIEGLNVYENARRSGGAVAGPALAPTSGGGRSPQSVETVSRALQLLESGQPRQALQMLEFLLLGQGARDPFTLAVAGQAAYQCDLPRKAMEYWAESLAARPNPAVQALYQRAERELRADESRDALHGGRFVLRYNRVHMPPQIAANLVAALDEQYARIDAALGCGFNEQVTVAILDPESYRAATGAAEWSSGLYDGRIRVALRRGEGLTPEVRRTLAHELVHACLARRGHFPAWFHEGMAQKWSGESLNQRELTSIRQRLRARQMPSLANLGQSWSRLSAEHASLAYTMALAAVETLYQSYGDSYVRELLRSPPSLAPVADTLSRHLAQ